MTCQHAAKETSTTEVLIGKEWIPSTTYIRCAECGLGLGIKTRKAAFMADSVPRRGGEWKPEPVK
jgi:hypothetical protein